MTLAVFLLVAMIGCAVVLSLIPFMEGGSPRDDLVGTVGLWSMAALFIAGGVLGVVQSS